MKQLKFGKNGFVFPQKISYEVKYEEEPKEAIKNIELEKELMKALEVLAPGDRNIKALTIFCNPNYIHGPDYLIQEKIQKILKNCINQGIVKKEKSPKGRDVFSLIKSKSFKKNRCN